MTRTNERIQKLALETDAWCDQNWTGHEFYNLRWEEKFAELIIQRCISQIALLGISNFENEDINWTVSTAIKNIQEDFGVNNE